VIIDQRQNEGSHDIFLKKCLVSTFKLYWRPNPHEPRRESKFLWTPGVGYQFQRSKKSGHQSAYETLLSTPGTNSLLFVTWCLASKHWR